MSPIALAALVYGLGAAISMFVAALIKLLFVGIQAAKRRAAAPALAAGDPEMPVLRPGGGGEVLS